MATRFYPAILEPARTGYGVWFPDVPGCISAGDSAQQAASNAIEALALHFDGAAEDGDPIPDASDPAAVAVPRGSTLAMVPVELPGKVVRLSMTMDEGTLAKADRLAAARGTTRSGLLAELVRAAAAPLPAVKLRKAARARKR